MACVYFRKDRDCEIAVRCQNVCGKPKETTCPHEGEGTKCEFIKRNLAESHDPS